MASIWQWSQINIYSYDQSLEFQTHNPTIYMTSSLWYMFNRYLKCIMAKEKLFIPHPVPTITQVFLFNKCHHHPVAPAKQLEAFLDSFLFFYLTHTIHQQLLLTPSPKHISKDTKAVNNNNKWVRLSWWRRRKPKKMRSHANR